MGVRTLTAASLLAMLAACTPARIELRPLARPADLNTELLADLNAREPAQVLVVREVELPGEGTLTVTAQPLVATSRLELRVVPVSGGEPAGLGASPLEVQHLPAGRYYVVVRPAEGGPTKVRLATSFRPRDPDAASGPDARPEGATRIEPNETARGEVDALRMDRTDHWRLTLPAPGSLSWRFRPTATRGEIVAELVPPRGDVQRLDPRHGQHLVDAPEGEYLVRVQASDDGAGEYVLETTFAPADPDELSSDDRSREGATHVDLLPRPGRPSLVAAVRDSVDHDARDRTDWFRIEPPQKGRLSVAFRPADRTSRIRAFFVADEDDEAGERLRPHFALPVEPRPYWVKVVAPDRGDAGRYTLEMELRPAAFIEAVVKEVDRRSGCVVLVDRGVHARVKTGAEVRVIEGDEVVVSGIVDAVFAALSRVRLFDGECSVSPGAQVRIDAEP